MGHKRALAGFVYVFQLGDFYKIGSSRNPIKRLKVFGKLPYQSAIIHAIASEHAGRVERAFHKVLHRQRVNGEWFRLSSEEIALLKSQHRIDTPDDLPEPLLSEYRWVIGLRWIRLRVKDELYADLESVSSRSGESLECLVLRILKDHTPEYVVRVQRMSPSP